MTPPRVLLSFAGAYAGRAQGLAAVLRDARLDVRLDPWDGGGGAPGSQRLPNDVASADFVLPLLTPSDAAPTWIGEAWRVQVFDAAHARGVPVLPVLGEGSLQAVPEFLRASSFADLRGRDAPDELRRLLRTMHERCGDGAVVVPDNVAMEAPSPLAVVAHPLVLELGAAWDPRPLRDADIAMLFDGWLQAVPYAALLFAVLAISGLPHAFNIIDGYNGLAGTVAVQVCLAITHVSLQLGDRPLAAMVVCLVGATLGFLMWNYPRGKIFAGDGGAYVWGTVIAVACVALVQRHGTVSPWFPMLLLIYPVWETLFSIYRKMARGQSPGDADALHFHQLIFRRIVRVVVHDSEARALLSRNNRTSPYLWIFAALSIVPAVLFWNNTVMLMAFCLLFVATYVAAYLMIVRFKVPRWLRP